MNHVGLHVAHVIPFCPGVVWILDAVVDDAVFLRQRIRVHAVHHADSLDQATCVPTVLAPDQFVPGREILIDDRFAMP
jgi:hypothetical protein